jgi:hypothetical protein
VSLSGSYVHLPTFLLPAILNSPRPPCSQSRGIREPPIVLACTLIILITLLLPMGACGWSWNLCPLAAQFPLTRISLLHTDGLLFTGKWMQALLQLARLWGPLPEAQNCRGNVTPSCWTNLCKTAKSPKLSFFLQYSNVHLLSGSFANKFRATDFSYSI